MRPHARRLAVVLLRLRRAASSALAAFLLRLEAVELLQVLGLHLDARGLAAEHCCDFETALLRSVWTVVVCSLPLRMRAPVQRLFLAFAGRSAR